MKPKSPFLSSSFSNIIFVNLILLISVFLATVWRKLYISIKISFLDGSLIDFRFLMFNATFSNISAISWRLVLVVEEAEVPGENHRSWASNW